MPNPSQTSFKGCPILGVGLGLRRPLLHDTLAAPETHPSLIDWLEFTPENFVGRGAPTRQILQDALEKFPLVSHGVSLSIGSADPFHDGFLQQVKELFAWVNPPWMSDHLCFSSIDGKYFNDLLPLPQTLGTVSYVADRVRYLEDYFQRPMLIENISQYVHYDSDTLTDAEFITGILETADCGLLLDVNNIYVNAENHQQDGYAFLDNIPLERVVQIHVAGHDKRAMDNGSTCLIDTHGAPVCTPVWDILDWTLSRCNPCGVMLERDTDIPDFSELVPELQRIRGIWDRTQIKKQPAHDIPSTRQPTDWPETAHV